MAWLLAIPVIFIFWNETVCAQNLTETLKELLPRPDKYKLTKAQVFAAKGDTLLAKSGRDLVLQRPGFINKDDDGYLNNQIKASYCYRTANGQFFDVYDKHIRSFWKGYTGSKNGLLSFIKAENAAYDSLVKADQWRLEAENLMYIEDKIALVTKAERTEKAALIQIEKVLYIYLTGKTNVNPTWLVSTELTLPATTVAQRTSSTVDSAISPKNIPSNILLASQQPGKFEEFARTTGNPTQIGAPINYTEIHNDGIDSAQRKWQRETTFKNIFADTSGKATFAMQNKAKSNPSSKTNVTTITNKPAVTNTLKANDSLAAYNLPREGLLFKIQIAASRHPMTVEELNEKYSGSEKIVDTFEDEWYKYRIGNFTTLEAALKYLPTTNVSDAFVVGFLNGKKIELPNNVNP
jgi:hypothetical protein